MLANMCVESHLRELLEQGFEVVVVKDATAAPKHPEWGYGYTAALINYAYLAHAVWTTAASAELSADFKRRATAHQRTVRCAVYPYVLWRETEAEAEAEIGGVEALGDPAVNLRERRARLLATGQRIDLPGRL